MPAMGNITVKNVANADVIYVAKVASAGDKTPAKWSVDAAHAIVGFRPWMTVNTRDNGPKNARIVEAVVNAPVIAVVNGADTIVARVPVNLAATLPTNVSGAAVYDAIFQATNLFVSTLMRDVYSTGYSPT